MIDVIIPIHNEDKTLFEVIDSLLAQSVKPNKIIFVLDRCTDKSAQIVEGMKGNVVVVHKNETRYKTFLKGKYVAESINAGLPYADSDNIMVLNADSIISHDYIKESLCILKDEQYGLVGYSDGINISGSGYTVRSSILKKIGNLFECGAEDTHLQFSVMALGYKLGNLEYSELVLLRKRGEGKITDKIKYHFAKGYSSYQLGGSLYYQVLKLGYWILKRKPFGVFIPIGFLYAYLTVDKLSIAASGIAKKWERSRLR